MKFVLASTRKTQQFIAIFANLKNFTDNVSLFFREKNIYIQCLDDSHCCLFECQLDQAWFKEYTYDPMADQACIGVNIAMLNKVLNAWNDTQELSIETDPVTDKVAINYEKGNAATGHFNKYFELSLMTLENNLMDVKVKDTLVDLTVDSKIFCALINQLTIFDNNLTFTFNEDNIECVSSGTEGSMKALINIAEVKEYAIPESTILKQSYSLRYVQMMCHFNKLAAEIKMGFSEDMPMVMKYSLDDPVEKKADASETDASEAAAENSDDEEEEEENTESFVRIHLAPKIMDTEL
jgi:proliferating cell nuclear antigen PCNA